MREINYSLFVFLLLLLCVFTYDDGRLTNMACASCLFSLFIASQIQTSLSLHTTRLIQLIEKRKQQLLRAAAASAQGNSMAPCYSNGTRKCHLNENSDECNISRTQEREVKSREKRQSLNDTVDGGDGDDDVKDECTSCGGRYRTVDTTVAADVNDLHSIIKYKTSDEMNCDSRASLQSMKTNQVDNDCHGDVCVKSKRKDKRSVKTKLKGEKSKLSSLTCGDDGDDDIFTSASHIIIQESSSESEDEEIRKIMCAKKLTSNGESIYRKMNSTQCESMSDEDDDDDDDDTTLPISLDRSESTAYKQQDTTIVYFTHRRDQIDSSISPQLNLPSSDLSCNSPVLTSTTPTACTKKQDN